MKDAYTYILTNKNRTTLYLGVTNDLERRIFEHKAKKGSAFCVKYNVDILLYFEHFSFMAEAIAREKQLKRWHREWKWNLIKSKNPELKDLSEPWFDRAMLKDIKAYSMSEEGKIKK